MSKLVEKLERLSAGKGQPLGFTAAAARTKVAQMVLVASLPEGDHDLVATAVEGGADALLIRAGEVGEELSKLGKEAKGIPWGVAMGVVSKEQAEAVAEMGCDFLVFASEAAAGVLDVERLGRVLQIDPALSDSLMRAVASMAVDGVLVDAEQEQAQLTVGQLMAYERLAGLVDKPLLAAIPAGMPAADVEGLWQAGVRGVVVDMAAAPKERLAELRAAIASLPAMRKRPGGRLSAVVPHPAEWPPAEPAEEEEEEF